MSEDVGYKKPPKHGQFKKGQSGNPGGKPRPPTTATKALAAVLARRVTVNDGDEKRRMSNLEAVMDGLVRKAIGGDARCLKLAFEHIASLEHNLSEKFAFEDLCIQAADAEAIAAAEESTPAAQRDEIEKIPSENP